MAAYFAHADGIQEIHGGTQADDFGDGWRASFKLVGKFGIRKAIKADLADHSTATEERRHRLEQLFARPQHPNSCGPTHFVTAESEHVGTHGLHVGRHVGHRLASINDGDRACGVCCSAKFARGVDGAEHI